ncbi:Uncharacterized protein TCAP_02502 [Tolypocladium capitatum]|uniref:Uncharacterized protein n=1 Tax=Tolypocladium capitatum TaxID=45235 RepID=A0A2K3QJ50_9HYPO|nr:Uncharacterized protein TCAP_02502 [Tolypocladium capitatum]
MTQLVAVALYSRDHFSRGNARRIFGYEAYHWGILIMPQKSQGRDCQAFEATDASNIDPVTFRMTNPTMDWRFRATENVDPTLSAKLLGRIVIGQVPDGVSSAELRDFFESVPLPVKNTHPQQSCVTWAVDAIRSLQSQGWVWKFELDRFKDMALSYADERMKGLDSTEPSVKHYSI